MRLILWLLCFSGLLAGSQLSVEVHARSAILMNAETGAVLFERHAHLPSFPASTTKIGTALYLLDQERDLSAVATVTRSALKHKPKGSQDPASWWLESDGTMMNLRVGEILPLEALLYGLMMISGNDAANTIAEHVGGSVPQFVDGLNDYLKRIGCTNTQFSNPHGLTHPEHFTTAYDLALMMRKALQLPKFREVIGVRTYMKARTNKQPQSEIVHTNPMTNPNSRFYYAKAIGGKTGYTNAAKFTLAVAAEHEGRELIAVLLGCDDKARRYQDAKRLFEAAFNEKKMTRRLVGPETIFNKQMMGAQEELKAALVFPLSISFFPAEEPECKAVLHWSVTHLPVKKGQKVGEIHILGENDRFLEKGNLIAVDALKGSFFFVLKDKFCQFFR